MSVQQFLLGETMLETALASGALGQRYVMQRLATPQGVEATQPGQDYPDIDAKEMQAFTQWCDPERAMDCLAEAMSLKYHDIDAMDWRQQWDAVRRSWRYFALYFQYMNLDIYGWHKFRRVMQQALGTSRDRQRYSGYFDTRQSSALGQRMPNTGFIYAYWRKRMIERYMSLPDKWQPGRHPDTATFIGTGVEDVDRISDETHRLWIDGFGNVLAIDPTIVGSAFPGHRYIKTDDRPGSASTTVSSWHEMMFGERNVGSSLEIHLTMAAPIVWYWELLFGKVPGLRVGATVENLFPQGTPPPYQTGNYAYHQTAVVASPKGSALSGVMGGHSSSGIIEGVFDPSGDLSLAEYMMRMGPAAMVMEIRRGVITTNNVIIDYVQGHGISLGSPTTAQDQELNRIAQQNNEATTIAKMGMVLSAALIAIPTPTTIAMGAVIGLGSFVGGLLNNVLTNHPVAEMRDVFGRILDSRIPRDMGYLEFFRRYDPSVSSGLMSFLSYWGRINVANQDIVSTRRSLNEILKTNQYVRSVLGFPAWLDPEVFKGVPGYTGKPDIRVFPSPKTPAHRVLLAVLGGTAVVGAVGLALMKRETVVPVLAQGWQGTRDWAGRTADKATALVRGRPASAALPPGPGAAQT